jgi:hypothetical protein
MVGITLLALGIAIGVIVACRRLAEGDQTSAAGSSIEETNSVISEE